MLKTLTDDIFVAPQISVADVEEAKALGVKLVINNRPDHESPDQTEGNEIEEAARAAGMAYDAIPVTHAGFSRSEERRVGKECVRPCRSRWAPENLKKKHI